MVLNIKKKILNKSKFKALLIYYDRDDQISQLY